jgi:hypothetical protein
VRMNSDYEKYTEECRMTGEQIEPRLSFYQRVGLHLVAKKLQIENPMEWILDIMQTMSAERLYLMEEFSKRKTDITQPIVLPKRAGDCGGCGAELVEMSIGLGDTIAKITKATGLDKLAEMYTKITGKDCGCKTRQEYFNKLLPYKVQERT